MKRIEFFFKNILLKILLSLQHKQNYGRENKFDEKSKILFIRLNRIGDALVTTPLLHEIKMKIKAKIYVLADKKNKEAYLNNPDIDELIIFEKGLKGFFKVLNLIKREGIQTVVDLHDDVSTTVSFLIALCTAGNKFGLEKDNKIIFTKTVPRLNAAKYHVVERIFELTKLFGIKPEARDIHIIYQPDSLSYKKAEDFIRKNYTQKRFIAGVNISAGSPSRFWGIENFKKLLNYFSLSGADIVILSSPGDKETAMQITDSHFIYYLSETFSEFAAMISELDFLFTPDTAAIHLASAFNIPSFGVYVKYKTNDMIWSPYNTKFDCVITEKENLSGVPFEEVIIKLKPFTENIFRENNVYRQS